MPVLLIVGALRMSAGRQLRETALESQQEQIRDELYHLFCWDTIQREVLPELKSAASKGAMWWETTITWIDHTREESVIGAWNSIRDRLQEELEKEELRVSFGVERRKGVMFSAVKIMW